MGRRKTSLHLECSWCILLPGSCSGFQVGRSPTGTLPYGSSLGGIQNWIFPAEWGRTVSTVSLCPETNSLQVFTKTSTFPPVPSLSLSLSPPLKVLGQTPTNQPRLVCCPLLVLKVLTRWSLLFLIPTLSFICRSPGHWGLGEGRAKEYCRKVDTFSLIMFSGSSKIRKVIEGVCFTVFLSPLPLCIASYFPVVI